MELLYYSYKKLSKDAILYRSYLSNSSQLTYDSIKSVYQIIIIMFYKLKKNSANI